MTNDPWILSIIIVLVAVITPTEITAPLPALAFPVPNVPIPRVSPTAKFLPPFVNVTTPI